jgi:hypothetical protein
LIQAALFSFGRVCLLSFRGAKRTSDAQLRIGESRELPGLVLRTIPE